MNAVWLVDNCILLAGIFDGLCPIFGFLDIGKTRTGRRGLSGSCLLLIDHESRCLGVLESLTCSLGARLEIGVGYLTKYWKRSRAVVTTAMLESALGYPQPYYDCARPIKVDFKAKPLF